jgi:hypothetical protein
MMIQRAVDLGDYALRQPAGADEYERFQAVAETFQVLALGNSERHGRTVYKVSR